MNAWLRSEIRIHKFSGLIFCLAQIWPLAIISKYFGPKKSGLGPPRAHSGQFYPQNWNWLFLRVKFFFPLSRLCVAGRIFFCYKHTWAQCQTWLWAKNFFEIDPFMGRLGQKWPKYGFHGFSQKPMCPPLPMSFECVFRWKLPQLTTYPRSGRPFLSRSDIF